MLWENAVFEGKQEFIDTWANSEGRINAIYATIATRGWEEEQQNNLTRKGKVEEQNRCL